MEKNNKTAEKISPKKRAYCDTLLFYLLLLNFLIIYHTGVYSIFYFLFVFLRLDCDIYNIVFNGCYIFLKYVYILSQ